MYKKINEFANYLMENSKKWNKPTFVYEQYHKHIVECKQLRESDDRHLQAELLDKAIIACIGKKLKITDEDFVELKQHLCDYGVVEFSSVEGLFEYRKKKFLSKLNLNGG